METGEQLRHFSLMDKRGLAGLASLSAQPPNSDYFPILQLRAPEARFTKSRATDFAMLQRSTLPILEVVGGYEPPAADRSLPEVVTDIEREVPLRAARAYRAALLSRSSVKSEHANKDVIYRLDAMCAGGRPCTEFDAKAWIEESASVAGATIPYLRTEDLEGVWINPAWVPACASADTLSKQALDLYDVISRRDWKRVSDIGSSLLASGDVKGLAVFEPYTLRATELAHLALGETDAVARIENRYGSGSRSDAFERSFLMSQADVDAHAAHAKRAPAQRAASLSSTD
jgi:hypothetical protein